ncbi:hypothetical protein LTR17_008143 [Elasticomyces elasticus]|nr:hypothetical protein LTR17_008143 [Elasticomyces elasticus]
MLSSLLTTLSLAALALGHTSKPYCSCLTDAEAFDLVNGFRIVASIAPGYEAVANRTLSEDFISISDGVNFAARIPLNTTETTSRAQLLEQEAQLPPTGAVRDIFVSHTCDTITWYFEFATKPLPTRGIAILFVNAEKKIYKSYREVNNAALLYNLGQPECQPNFTVSVGNQGPAAINATCKSCVGS